jgi:membrane protease YdiL (CAAX protease family)
MSTSAIPHRALGAFIGISYGMAAVVGLVVWLVKEQLPATPALVLGALGLPALLGTYPLDVTDYSGLRAMLARAPGAEALLEQVTPAQFLVGQVVQAILFAPLINALFTFGEEWGWRGWLLPRLLPLGQWRALVLSGAIWGLWHAPLTLQGHNYPTHPFLGVLFMTVLCVLMGILLGWLRLASGSVWPAVIAHGSLNGLGPLVLVLAREGAPLDTAQAGITGWPGWLLMGALVALLVLTGKLPVRRPQVADAEASAGTSPS